MIRSQGNMREAPSMTLRSITYEACHVKVWMAAAVRPTAERWQDQHICFYGNRCRKEILHDVGGD
jgi:hypothetical protein